MMPTPATPEYDLDDVVLYRDDHGRLQSGRIQGIQASWRSRRGAPPLIIFDVSHPTYRGKHAYVGVDDIISMQDKESGI